MSWQKLRYSMINKAYAEYMSGFNSMQLTMIRDPSHHQRFRVVVDDMLKDYGKMVAHHIENKKENNE